MAYSFLNYLGPSVPLIMGGILLTEQGPQQKLRTYIWESLLLFRLSLSNIYSMSVPDVQLKKSSLVSHLCGQFLNFLNRAYFDLQNSYFKSC